MTDVIVELPLRTIHYKLFDRPAAPIEANALVLYKDLHHQVWDAKLYWEEGRPIFEKAYTLISELQQLYNQMEHEIHKYGKLAGFKDEDVPLPPGETEMEIRLTDLEDIVTAYSNKVDEYDVIRKQLDEMFATGDEMQEHFTNAIEYFDKKIFSPIIQDYNNVQIDTVTFDRDFDNFRHVCGTPDDMRDDLVDDWNDLAKEIDILSNKMTNLNPHIGYLNSTLNSLPPQLPEDPSLN